SSPTRGRPWSRAGCCSARRLPSSASRPGRPRPPRSTPPASPPSSTSRAASWTGWPTSTARPASRGTRSASRSGPRPGRCCTVSATGSRGHRREASLARHGRDRRRGGARHRRRPRRAVAGVRPALARRRPPGPGRGRPRRDRAAPAAPRPWFAGAAGRGPHRRRDRPGRSVGAAVRRPRRRERPRTLRAARPAAAVRGDRGPALAAARDRRPHVRGARGRGQPRRPADLGDADRAALRPGLHPPVALGLGRRDGAAVTAADTWTPSRTAEMGGLVLDRVGEAVVGKREELTLVLAAVLAGGHVLLEDFPGLGKTLAARSFAQTLGLSFRRVQFTPDLVPADITGSFAYDQGRGEFTFRPGPLFAGLVLADEINRTPPKTQSALLEAMQEHQVTVEGQTFGLPDPFCVLATANPVEYEGTYPLPEAQLDRFLLRVSFGYPAPDEECQVLARRLGRRQEGIVLDPVTDAAGLLAMRRAVESVEVEESVSRYCVALATATRARPEVAVGASPRGA